MVNEMEFLDFTDMVFLEDKQIVYVLYFKSDDRKEIVPFYVGESARGIGRFGDYVSAQFTASTDFKVGEAIRYLRSLRLVVGIKYKVSQYREAEEKKLIAALRKERQLLNDLKGYDYKLANEDDERAKVREFIMELVQKNARSEESPRNPIKPIYEEKV